ncbi:MAG: NAD(P)H-quinone oxidoreductase subunit 2, partial [Synechococcaceae cyanobacterium]
MVDASQAAGAAIAAGLSTSSLNLQLNAAAIAPETAVLLTLLACLIVDLFGEQAASRWVPPLCYGGLGAALVL